MKVSKGDLIEVMITGSAGGAVFEKSEKPLVVFAGEGQVVKGLDDALLAAEVGSATKVSLAPENAFGERRDDAVRLIPLEQFHRQGLEPVAGLPVELDGVPARIQSVSGGRVRVDFNHELAGKLVEYEFTIQKSFSTPADKVTGMQEHMLSGCTAVLEGSVVKVSASAGVRKDTDFISRKLGFVARCLRYVPGVKTVSFCEDYESPDSV